ncbi:MAG: SusC/RagA family TonB-linked outer membrane protein, partial [Bacteroidota bacterium]|nr:SusC/RagA family TonB-linked outer membrane protein [Bacteroidota bacterium]
MKRTFRLDIAYAMLLAIPLLLLGIGSSAQVTKVTGTIRDAAGNPVSGVTVREKGVKSGGTISDESGNFSVRVRPNATLVFSSVGFVQQEVPVNGSTVLTIQLARDSKELSEVVVTGFGVKKETRKLGYSITEVKGAELVSANNSNIGDALQGKVAGVTITQGTGGPSSSSRIQIRGNARLAGNTEPLVVIDGILIQPGTTGADSWGGNQDFGNIIKDLNPDDYESVTVLKGSAASALYGPLALNGVLLITTKKGHAQKGVGVQYNQIVQFDKAYKTVDFQNEFGGGLSSTFAKDGSGNDIVDVSASPYFNPNGGYSYGPKFDGHLVKDLDGRMVPWVPNDPLKDFYTTGQFINTNVVAQGGNDNGGFRISYTNLNNSSIMPNNHLGKNSFAFHGNQRLTNVISMDASVSYTSTYVLNPINQGGGGTQNGLGGILYLAPRNGPVAYFRNHYVDPVVGGRLNGFSKDPYFLAGLFWPFFEENASRTENLLLANLDVTAKLAPWLTALVRTNVTNYNDITEYKNNGRSAGFTGSSASYQLIQSSYKNTRVQGLLTGNHAFGKDFVLTSTLGGEIDNNWGGPTSNSQTNGGLATPGLYFISNSVNSPTTSVTFTPSYRSAAAYLYGDLTWRDMLTLNYSLRNEWSSSLVYADGHGDWSYTYPAVSLAWVFTELPSFKARNSILSFGKLRAAIGWTGFPADPYKVNSTGNYGSIGTFNNKGGGNNTLYSFSDGNGNYNTSLGNQHLHAELAREIEFGTDIRFFNNRLGFDIAYYKKNSFNQILPLAADQETGISSRTINAGNIQNSGIEALITANPVKGRDFSWDMTINIAHNSNKIISLVAGTTNYQLDLAFGADAAAYAIAGKDYGIVQSGYAYAYYNNKAHAAAVGQKVLGSAPNGTTGNYLTYMRSQDYDGSQRILGTIMPTLLWGTQQNLTYKNFSLGIQIDSKVGGLMASATDQYGSETGNLKNSLPGRNKALGGVTYTDGSGTHDDGIIPKGVINDGIIVGGKDLGGMTYADAVAQGYEKPIPAYAYYENLTQWS